MNRRRHSPEDAQRRERRPRSRERPPRPEHRTRSRHRSTSRRRSRSTVRYDPETRDPSRDYRTRTREPVSKSILELEYGDYPDIWRFVAAITNIEAGRWGAQTAYFVQVDISIEKYALLENFEFSLWLVPILASGCTDPGTDVMHCGPEFLEGEITKVHHNRERGADGGINVGVNPVALNAAVHANNNEDFDIKVSGGLATTCSPDRQRLKLFTQVYQNKKTKKGVPHKVRLYAVVVCPDAVALDVSAEVDVTWRKRLKNYLSTLRNPVHGSGLWDATPLPELQPESNNYETWQSDDYRRRATNDTVIGRNIW